MWCVVAAIALGGLLVGCGAPSPPSSPEPRPVVAEGRDDAFVIQIAAAQDRYAVGQPMRIVTRLTYSGPLASIQVAYGGAGPVVVCLEQVDGPFDPGCGSDSSCQRTTLQAGVPLEAPYEKTGAFSADDRLAADYRAFFADPQVRLPAGAFRFTATAEVSEGDCGGPRHNLSASITVQVAP